MRAILNALRDIMAGIWNLATWPIRTASNLFDMLFRRAGQDSSPEQAAANEESKVAAEASRDGYRNEARQDLRAFRKLLTCQLNGRPLDDAAVERLVPHVVARIRSMSVADCERLLASPAPDQLRMARSAVPEPAPEENVVDLASRREQRRETVREALRARKAPVSEADAVLQSMGRCG